MSDDGRRDTRHFVWIAAAVAGLLTLAFYRGFIFDGAAMRGTDSAALASTVGAAGAGLTDLGGMSSAERFARHLLPSPRDKTDQAETDSRSSPVQ